GRARCWATIEAPPTAPCRRSGKRSPPLPSSADSSGKSSVLESIVGRDFLPRGSG
ncbi:hypothetical protein BHM03_00014492, partial [Ensete ventricosum]